MRLIRPRFTLRRLMIAVVVAGVISLNGLLVARQVVTEGLTAEDLILAGFGCTFGLASMRHPLITLGILIAANGFFGPNLYGSCNSMSLPASGCTIGWLIGAPTGWISRHSKKPLPPEGKPSLSGPNFCDSDEL